MKNKELFPKLETWVKCVNDEKDPIMFYNAQDWVKKGYVYLVDDVERIIGEESAVCFVLKTRNRERVIINDEFEGFRSDRFIIMFQYILN